MKLDEIVFWCISNNIFIKSGYQGDDFACDRKTVALARLAGEIVTRTVADTEMTPESLTGALNECVEEFKSKYETRE